MNNLTIDDIHRIRREHADSTQNMSFDDYKANLKNEIKPLFDLLMSMKQEKKNNFYHCTEIETSVVAEPQTIYQVNNNN